MNLEKCLSHLLNCLTGTSAAVNRYQSWENIHFDCPNSTVEVKGEQAPFARPGHDIFFIYLFIINII